MERANGARRVAVREMQGSVQALTPAEKRAVARSRSSKEREHVIAHVNAAASALAPEARSDGDVVLAIFEAVMRKESRALVRRDQLDDLMFALRDMGCEHDLPNDNPRWKRLKAAYRAMKLAIESGA